MVKFPYTDRKKKFPGRGPRCKTSLTSLDFKVLRQHYFLPHLSIIIISLSVVLIIKSVSFFCPSSNLCSLDKRITVMSRVHLLLTDVPFGSCINLLLRYLVLLHFVLFLCLLHKTLVWNEAFFAEDFDWCSLPPAEFKFFKCPAAETPLQSSSLRRKKGRVWSLFAEANTLKKLL